MSYETLLFLFLIAILPHIYKKREKVPKISSDASQLSIIDYSNNVQLYNAIYTQMKMNVLTQLKTIVPSCVKMSQELLSVAVSLVILTMLLQEDVMVSLKLLLYHHFLLY